MRTFAILVVLAAAVVGALFALGVFEPGEPTPEPPPVPPGTAPGTGPGGLAPRVPETEPPLEETPVDEPIQGLMLMEFPQRFGLFMLQQWGVNKRIHFRAWGPPKPEGPEGTNRPDMSAVRERLDEAPRPSMLDADDIQVLVLHDLDPNVLEKEFWEAAAARVRAGRMGLLVLPGVRTGKAMLAHEVLGPLLPVAKAQDPAGTGAGATNRPYPFEVTEAGVTHPATRLVHWREWSRKIWVSTRAADFPWGTKFCYPVDRVSDGALVLLEAERPRDLPLPAIVVGPESVGRVMWFGTWELGDRSKDDTMTAYGNTHTVERWGILLRNCVAWLAGREAP